jgi:imidazole glycerol-phosphate synthase subunit HisF
MQHFARQSSEIKRAIQGRQRESALQHDIDVGLLVVRSKSDTVHVIASGGVGNLDHLADGIQTGGADAVLAASIFHYGEYTVQQAKQRMRERGIPVRL